MAWSSLRITAQTPCNGFLPFATRWSKYALMCGSCCLALRAGIYRAERICLLPALDMRVFLWTLFPESNALGSSQVGWAHAVRAHAENSIMQTVGKKTCPPYTAVWRMNCKADSREQSAVNEACAADVVPAFSDMGFWVGLRGWGLCIVWQRVASMKCNGIEES